MSRTEVAAAWFETVLRKPVVRHEWERNGHVYARLYQFADTGQELVSMYDKGLAPHEVTASPLTDPTRAEQVWGHRFSLPPSGSLPTGTGPYEPYGVYS